MNVHTDPAGIGAEGATACAVVRLSVPLVVGPLVSVHGTRPEAVSYNESANALQLVWIAARSSLRDVFDPRTARESRERM